MFEDFPDPELQTTLYIEKHCHTVKHKKFKSLLILYAMCLLRSQTDNFYHFYSNCVRSTAKLSNSSNFFQNMLAMLPN